MANNKDAGHMGSPKKHGAENRSAPRVSLFPVVVLSSLRATTTKRRTITHNGYERVGDAVFKRLWSRASAGAPVRHGLQALSFLKSAVVRARLAAVFAGHCGFCG